MDIEKLIKRLKCPQIQSCPMDGEYPSCKACQKSIQQEVTTALSTLQAENEKLRAELEQVKSERDAAVEWIQWFTESIGRPCEACEHFNKQDDETYCKGCGSMGAPSCNWKWRGIKKED